MSTARGKVIEGSFHIEQEVEVDEPRQKVWAAMLDVQSWWCHHFGDSSVRMTLEPKVGGQFRQDWGPKGPDGGVLYGTVTELKPPERITFMGQLGMIRLPVTSVYSWELSEKDGGKKTVLKLTHRAIGVLDENWHQSHEDGWRELWVNLKKLVVEGKRVEREK